MCDRKSRSKCFSFLFFSFRFFSFLEDDPLKILILVMASFVQHREGENCQGKPMVGPYIEVSLRL